MRYVARVLREFGLGDLRGTPVVGDQGADLLGRKDGRAVVIQIKRRRDAVGNRAVQEAIAATKFYGADEAWVVTNSTFTRSARVLAQKSQVKLIDGAALGRLQKGLLRES